MIGSIHSNSPSVQVSFGGGSNYVNGYAGQQGVGDMRYNTSTQKTEVYDGTTWISLNYGTATVGLSSEVEELLAWARKKRAEEWERERLAESSPAIKDLLNQIKEKEDQIKMVQTLLNSPGHDEIKPSMIP